MITKMNSWSLGATPNKSVDLVDPFIRSHSQSDLTAAGSPGLLPPLGLGFGPAIPPPQLSAIAYQLFAPGFSIPKLFALLQQFCRISDFGHRISRPHSADFFRCGSAALCSFVVSRLSRFSRRNPFI